MISDSVRKKYNLNVITGILKENIFQEKYFDVIRLGDVLEHLTQPNQALRIINLYLKDDGLLMVSQPLTYNRSFFNLMLTLKMVFRKNKFSVNPPYHLWEFGPFNLERFLKRCGFSNILFKKIYESNSYSGQLRFATRICKAVSYFISSFPLLGPLLLGNRMLVIAKKF